MRFLSCRIRESLAAREKAVPRKSHSDLTECSGTCEVIVTQTNLKIIEQGYNHHMNTRILGSIYQIDYYRSCTHGISNEGRSTPLHEIFLMTWAHYFGLNHPPKSSSLLDTTLQA